MMNFYRDLFWAIFLFTLFITLSSLLFHWNPFPVGLLKDNPFLAFIIVAVGIGIPLYELKGFIWLIYKEFSR